MGYCTELLYNESNFFKALFDFKGTDRLALSLDLRGRNFKKEDFLILLHLLGKKFSSFNFYIEGVSCFLRIAKIVNYLSITRYESTIDDLLLKQLEKLDAKRREDLEAVLTICEQIGCVEKIKNQKQYY